MKKLIIFVFFSVCSLIYLHFDHIKKQDVYIKNAENKLINQSSNELMLPLLNINLKDKIKKVEAVKILSDPCSIQKIPKKDFDSDISKDYKTGIFNCQKFNNDKKSNDLFKDTRILVQVYLRNINKLRYPRDSEISEHFKFIFVRYNHLLKISRGTDFYPIISFILGDSALKSHSQDLEMVGPAILSELILDNNYTSNIKKLAWLKLNEEITFGHSGSSGTNR